MKPLNTDTTKKMTYRQMIGQVNKYLGEMDRIKAIAEMPSYNPDSLIVCVEGNRAYFNISDNLNPPIQP